jgi:hypothetical protein
MLNLTFQKKKKKKKKPTHIGYQKSCSKGKGRHVNNPLQLSLQFTIVPSLWFRVIIVVIGLEKRFF